jgi:hypothetical protein
MQKSRTTADPASLFASGSNAPSGAHTAAALGGSAHPAHLPLQGGATEAVGQSATAGHSEQKERRGYRGATLRVCQRCSSG